MSSLLVILKRSFKELFFIFLQLHLTIQSEKMKKLLFLLAVCGTLAAASCTKHACPAYGSTQKAVPSAPSERA